jgi:hypothetical protein
MNKENYREQPDLSLTKQLLKQYSFEFPEFRPEIEAIQDNDFALMAIGPLLKKREDFKRKEITGPVAKKELEMPSLLLKLRSIYNGYFLALVKYRKSPEQTEYQIRESLFADFNILKTEMGEEERRLYNFGSGLVHGLYPDEFGDWPATRSYQLNLLQQLFPKNEYLKNKPDPFSTDLYLKFYEEGVKPLYHQDKFFVHISLAEEPGVVRCWTPRDGYNSFFHPENTECDIRDKKTVAKKIIISQNKDNAQQSSLYRPGGR